MKLQKYKLIEANMCKFTPLSKETFDNKVIQRLYYLPKRRISSKNLEKVMLDLEFCRENNIKVIIRFAFMKEGDKREPSLSVIHDTIVSTCNLLNNYLDTIISLQLGYFGLWGEGYYTKHNKVDIAYSHTLVHKLFLGCIQLRTISQKINAFGLETIERVGFFNDAFLNTWGHGGTFNVEGENGVVSDEEFNIWNNQASIGGVISVETNGVNSPHTDWINAKIKLEEFSVSYINGYYLKEVIDYWEI